jgi:hypothetical protein
MRKSINFNFLREEVIALYIPFGAAYTPRSLSRDLALTGTEGVGVRRRDVHDDVDTCGATLPVFS